MPTVNPQIAGHRMPNDWRWAYDQFRQLKSLAASVGEPTGHWTLEFPSRGRRILDNRWSMTYSWEGVLYEKVFLGSNGKESAKAIAKIIPLYKGMVDRKKAERAKKKAPKLREPNPMFDNNKNREWRNRFNEAVKSVRDAESRSYFEHRNPNLIKYMKRRAGILQMSIQEYWFSHPHSNLFPAPPWNQDEFDRRQKILEAKVKQREDAVTQQKAAGTYDPRYTPPL